MKPFYRDITLNSLFAAAKPSRHKVAARGTDRAYVFDAAGGVLRR